MRKNTLAEMPMMGMIALFCTPEEATIISAAITHYLLSNTSQDTDIRAACRQLLAFQEHISEQLQAPEESFPSNADILSMLARLNQAARAARQCNPESEQWAVANHAFGECYITLVHEWHISLHQDPDSKAWQLGDAFTPVARKRQREQAALDVALFLQNHRSQRARE